MKSLPFKRIGEVVVGKNLLFIIPFVIFCLFAVLAEATVVKTDFESGKLGPWKVTALDNGVESKTHPLPQTEIVFFDVSQQGNPSLAVRLQITGEQKPLPAAQLPRGEGISRDLFLPNGDYSIDIQIAAASEADSTDAGTFRLYFDGQLVDSHSFGAIEEKTVVASTLSGNVGNVEKGEHRIQILITRGEKAPAAEAVPFGYIDNIQLATMAPQDYRFYIIFLGALLAILLFYRSHQPMKI